MSTTETAAEQAEHLRHPASAADMLRRAFAGEITAGYEDIAGWARDVLAERDRLHATLTTARMIATESATDDAGLLRQAILDQLGPVAANQGGGA